jgi:multiple sugar transport system ATP-binding protein
LTAVASGAQPDPGRLRAQVEVVEPMGSETLIYARFGEALLTVRQEAHGAARLGEQIDLALDLERAHLFDARGGEAIF